MPRRPLAVLAALSLVVAACAASDSPELAEPDSSSPVSTSELGETTKPGGSEPSGPADGLIGSDGQVFGLAPEVPVGATDPALLAALDELFAAAETSEISPEQVAAVAGFGDARVAWYLSDLMRFIQRGPVSDALVSAFTELTGAQVEVSGLGSSWGQVTDLLIAWDLPAFDEYAQYKGDVFTLVSPAWERLFSDPDATIDWRLVSWGGVFIDNRPLGDQSACPGGCIPALDDPSVTDAGGGDWYPDEAVVFGVVVDGEARAYPKNIMEVHEMVNDTLGGRRIGLPYCTLCGSAQAYFTDSVAEGIDIPVLRTSGLLIRSNKVTYDLLTGSVFDTFTGEAVAGPLREAGVALEQLSVVTSTWAAWKEAYPDTTIVAEDGGIGRSYPADPLRGRDDNGPIFPIGDVDPRYEAQTPVIGVLTADGTPVAFLVDQATEALAAGETVAAGGVTLRSDGTGFRATAEDGSELVAHQAFWFAWTQFNPETLVWPGDG